MNFEQVAEDFVKTKYSDRITSDTLPQDIFGVMQEIVDHGSDRSVFQADSARKFTRDGIYHEYVEELIEFFKDQRQVKDREERLQWTAAFYHNKEILETSGNEYFSEENMQGLYDAASEMYDTRDAQSMIRMCYYYFADAFQKSEFITTYLFFPDFLMLFDGAEYLEDEDFQEHLHIEKFAETLYEHKHRFQYEIDMVLRRDRYHPVANFYKALFLTCIRAYISPWQPVVIACLEIVTSFRNVVTQFFGQTPAMIANVLAEENGLQPIPLSQEPIPPALAGGAGVELPTVQTEQDRRRRETAIHEFVARENVNPTLILSDTAKLITHQNARLTEAIRKCYSSQNLITEIEGLEKRQQYLKQALVLCIKDDQEPILLEDYRVIEESLVLASDGFVYAQSTLENLSNSPMTRQELDPLEAIVLQ